MSAVAVLAVAGCSDSTVAPLSAVDEQLLGDAELATPSDPLAAPVVQEWTDWVSANHHPVRSLTSSNFSDLEFLAPLLTSKRIVQLGESSHGVAEFSRAKLRLIKYLHQEQGYDVIAFESSIFECTATGEDMDRLRADQAVGNSLMYVWHTRELAELFQYVKSTQGSERPLTITGFDIQMTSPSGVATRPGFLRDMVSVVDRTYGDRVFELDARFVDAYRVGDLREMLVRDGNRYRTFYTELRDFIDANQVAITDAFPQRPHLALLARQTAQSMLQYVDQLRALTMESGMRTRDRAMADNLIFLADEMYPGRKIVVWAHNFHVRREQAHVAGDDYAGPAMGSYIAQHFRASLYTIALYMYRGEVADNDRMVYSVAPPAAGSIEAILYQTRRKFAFVEMSRERPDPGNVWMFSRVGAKSWGVRDLTMVPAQQYDAILFVDTVTPPSYLVLSNPVELSTGH